MLRIALSQFDFPIGDVRGNARRIVEMAAHARDALGARIVLFPELAISGYPPEDLLLRPSFLRACDEALHEVAAAVRGIVAVVGHPEPKGSVVYNAASVLRDGVVERTYRKRELPNYAVFDERRYFATGQAPCTFEVDGVRVGLVICEDLWFAQPLHDTAAAGAQVVLVPNASPYESDKPVERDTLLARRIEESGVALAYLNVVGGQDELVFDGASVLADADGRLHPAAEAFRDHWLVADFDPKTQGFVPVQWTPDPDESRLSLNWRALVRATRDYVRKNGFGRVWVGLSGGIDSALTLALAVDALGADAVTAVRMPSRFTSDASQDLAAGQARVQGVALLTVPVESPFAGFVDALAPHFAGRDPDTTEENLQARCRGAILMALSNKFGGLVLTTGNKSEYAVGYATIYGDMAGGFAPLKDVYKTEVYALAKYRNGLARVIPDDVITRAPTAELRANQTDQDSLPPYDVLDAILYRFVDLEHAPEEIVAEGFDEAIVRRVARLVFVNEYKRRQSAPGPKVSRRAFGRERRYPITSAWT